MNQKVLSKIISVISTGTIIGSSLLAASTLVAASDISNQKPYSQVLFDSESFNVDSSICNQLAFDHRADKYMRLKMSETKPVIIDCAYGLDSNAIEVVENVIAYYNDIFSTINDNYKFVVKSSGLSIHSTDTVIRVENATFKENVSGSFENYVNSPNTNEGNFFFKGCIKIDWNLAFKMGDEYAYYVFLHEFGHALGLGDVYYNGDYKNCDYVDMTTMMKYGESLNKLFPNDYAMLQALYSNEYKKCKDYQEAVNIVNEKIKKYTHDFYSYYAQLLKEKSGASGILNVENIPSSISWDGNYNNNRHLTYTISFISEEECQLTIMDLDGNVLESAKGEPLFVNGVCFIRNMYIENASNYTKMYPNDVSIKLMLSVYKNQKNELIVRDTTSYSMTTDIILSEYVSNLR